MRRLQRLGGYQGIHIMPSLPIPEASLALHSGSPAHTAAGSPGLPLIRLLPDMPLWEAAAPVWPCAASLAATIKAAAGVGATNILYAGQIFFPMAALQQWCTPAGSVGGSTVNRWTGSAD